MTDALTELEALYANARTCAKLVGLSYVENDTAGYSRQKHSKGFRYLDDNKQTLTDARLRKRIAKLVIPPGWQEVWICPSSNGHVLATGIDEKGRKQYIYHPRWRTMRDLIKFYRMIIFAEALPAIRTEIDHQLNRRTLDRPKIIGTMLWLLDNTYIRIGNDRYYEQNESVGLTTLTDKNVVVAGGISTLSFRAKSGKDQQISFENTHIAHTLTQLQGQTGSRLFRYKAADGFHGVEPADINAFLHELTGAHISAKDFRTWGGTLLAFHHLIEAETLPKQHTPAPNTVRRQAVDTAANVLGNTRAVARDSYVHPDLLRTYGTKDFGRFYALARRKQTIPGLDKRETELMYFLEHLFSAEFTLLRNGQ